MSGHSHAKNVMRKKQGEDKKRNSVFTKLLKIITINAKDEPNPDFNPTLRSAIDKAKKNNVPNDTIERAVKRGSDPNVKLEELVMEAYGPEGVAILMTAITDSSNRTVAEVKNILKKADAKWAESGSVLWAFTKNKETYSWEPNFPQDISEDSKNKLVALIEIIEEHEDIQNVYTNANI